MLEELQGFTAQLEGEVSVKQLVNLTIIGKWACREICKGLVKKGQNVISLYQMLQKMTSAFDLSSSHER